MKFQKGQPRPPNAGRKPGSKNKKKLKKVSEILAEAGIDPVSEILDLIPDMEYPEQKAKAWFDLLSYCQAKPKEIDDGDEGFSDEELLEQHEDTSEERLLQIVRDSQEGM